jgi:membrane-bound lytic murein transglycosylase D
VGCASSGSHISNNNIPDSNELSSVPSEANEPSINILDTTGETNPGFIDSVDNSTDNSADNNEANNGRYVEIEKEVANGNNHEIDTKPENGIGGQELLDTALEYCNAAQDFWIEGSLDKAIEALDEAYSLVLRVDTEQHPELIQQTEDLRFMISKRILEIYASRYTAVNGNECTCGKGDQEVHRTGKEVFY